MCILTVFSLPSGGFPLPGLRLPPPLPLGLTLAAGLPVATGEDCTPGLEEFAWAQFCALRSGVLSLGSTVVIVSICSSLCTLSSILSGGGQSLEFSEPGWLERKPQPSGKPQLLAGAANKVHTVLENFV